MATEENYDHLFTFKGGDLTLLATYKGKHVSGKVASQAMALASPLLVQPQIGVQGVENVVSSSSNHDIPRQRSIDLQVLDLTVDQGESLLILLHIAHFRFREVPELLGAYDFQKLATLCEKYQCRDIVSPWFGQWIKCLNPNPFVDSDLQQATLHCHIGWPFERQDLFNRVARFLVRNIHISILGSPVVKDTGGFFSLPMPEMAMRAYSKCVER